MIFTRYGKMGHTAGYKKKKRKLNVIAEFPKRGKVIYVDAVRAI